MSLRSIVGKLFTKTPPYIIEMQGTGALGQDGSSMQSLTEQVMAPPYREIHLKPREAVMPYTFSPDVFGCVKLKANLVSSLPLKIYWEKADGTRVERRTGPLYDLLHDPNPSRTMRQMIGDFLSWANLAGDAYIVLDSIGDRDYLFCLDPRYVVPILDKENRYEGVAYTKHQDKFLYYPKENVIHWQEFNPSDNWYGLSRISPLMEDIKARFAATKTYKETFERGGVGWAKMTVERNISEDLVADMKRDWKRRRNDQSRLMVVEDGRDFEFLDQANQQSALEVNNMTREAVCAVFGVPISIFNPNKNQDWLDAERFMWDGTLIPEAMIIAELFSKKLTSGINTRLRGQRYILEFDTAGIYALTQQKVELGKADVADAATGIRTINEIRTERGLPELTGDYAEFGNTPGPQYAIKYGKKPQQGVEGGRDQSATGEPQNIDTTGKR